MPVPSWLRGSRGVDATTERLVWINFVLTVIAGFAVGLLLWEFSRSVTLAVMAGAVTAVLGASSFRAFGEPVIRSLAESERKYRSLFENSRDAIMSASGDGDMLEANQAALDLLGYTSDELKSLNARDLYADRADRQRFLEQMPDTGPARDYEVKFKKKDGTVFDCLLTSSPRLAPDGTILGYQGILRDITDQKHADEVRRAAEEQIRLLAERNQAILRAVPDIIMEVDNDKVYTWSNGPGLEFFGEDVVGRSAADFFVGDQDTYERVGPLFEGEEDLIHVESWQRRADGEERLLAWTCRNLKNPDGNVAGALSAARDITEQHLAEVALRESEERLRMVTETINDAFWVTDWKTHRVVYVSPAYENIWGRTAQSLYANPSQWAEAIHPEDQQMAWENFVSLDESKWFDEEYRIIRPDGQTRWIRDRGFPFFGETGEVEFAVGVAQDITERKKLEAALQQLTEELEQRVAKRTRQLKSVNKELEDFTHTVSHDLRAPLRAICGFADIIERRYRTDLPDEAKRYFDHINDSGQQMTQLLEDLLQYSRLGRTALRVEQVHLSEFFEEIRETREGVITEVKGELVLASSLPSVNASRALLTQVFGNLIDNALIYTRSGVPPQISVDSRRVQDRIVVSVADNGVGIPAESREKIFDVFQRLESSVGIPGTGIGLAVVAKACGILGGRVWVESVEGEGSTFFVELPATSSIDRGQPQSDSIAAIGGKE